MSLYSSLVFDGAGENEGKFHTFHREKNPERLQPKSIARTAKNKVQRITTAI